MVAFRKAQKVDSKLRMSISGPSGSGKTWTSLVLATALADGKGVAVIDTERGSASKYADDFAFDVMELDTFHPDKFVAGIKEAEQAGYAVLVIDSLSHAWNGTGGLLEIVEAITKRSQSKNSFTAWSEATPIQNRLIDAITRANMHIIVTMRSKQEYALEKDERTGKTTPRKMGMAPIQRADLEYEFDVAADMDHENTMIVQKSRCSALSGAVISRPDAQVAETLKAWLHSDIPAPVKPQLHLVAETRENGHQNAQTASHPSHNGKAVSRPSQREEMDVASPAPDKPAEPKILTFSQLRTQAYKLGYKDQKQFEMKVAEVFGRKMSQEELLESGNLAKLRGALVAEEQKATNGAGGGR